MRSLLAIASIHEFPSISIEFLPAFTKADLDMDILMEIHLVMGVNGNRGEWFLLINNLKSGTFAYTRGSLRIQIKTQSHN